MSWVLRDYLSQYQFGSIADYLGHDTGLAALSAPHVTAQLTQPITVQTAAVTDERMPVSIIVPCCNERTALPYLANTLDSVTKLLERDYEVSFIFVDDGSVDNTWELLNRLFGNKKNCHLLQHTQNRGVTAAILTGIRHAESEIVCSIDCDCSYDPHDLLPMLRMLTDDVDLVTASPYHPQGKVVNVPRWRLSLSRGASWLYGKVLRHKLSTYTSCFRVYRRSKVVDLQPTDLGFLGITEILGLLDLGGAHIVEFPATLQVRILGYSKMKVARTVLGHLKNLWQLRQLRGLIDHNREIVFPFADPPLAISKRIGTSAIHVTEKKEIL
jgi:glycosyltransferase involved in cell wall biosynthesis